MMIIKAYLDFFSKKISQFSDNHPFLINVFQFLVFIYILLGLAFLTNDYLLPCLQRIVKKHKLSAAIGGFAIAVGNSVPELSTNLLSCLTDKPELVGFGFGAIVGSGVFDFTLCLGIAAIYSYYYHKKSIQFSFKALKRDLGIYILTLFYLVFVFWDHKITLFESAILVSFLPFYVNYIAKKQADEDEFVKEKTESSVAKYVTNSEAKYNIFVGDKENQKRRYVSYSNPYDSQGVVDSDEDNEDEAIELVEGKVGHDEEAGGLKPNYYQQNKTFQSKTQAITEDLVNKFYKPWEWLFEKTLNIEESPLVSFAIIMLYCFLITRFTIYTVDIMINWFSVSHTFIGLTVVSWGGNIGDVLNSIGAAKKKETEILTSSIIGSQIFNLQVCLGAPWLITNMIYGDIILQDQTIYTSILIVLLVVAMTFGLINLFNLQLNYGVGFSLIITYIFYAVFEYVQNQGKD